MQPDLLRQLRDVHLPQPPGLWPPAPGWWVLLVIAIVGVVAIAWWMRRRGRRQRPYRVARVELGRLAASFDAGRIGLHDLAHGTSALLKRVLIARADRKRVAPLTGDAWLGYLDEVNGSPAFTNGAGALLGARRFDPAESGDGARLIGLVEDFLVRLERDR
jgi:Domain of unknown function (DUF4381)